ncbi:MAG: hypothetical protein HYR66_04635 [Sphingobacteriales bacterium]|nr:hypothetical protein [Sphingobacteriales bacterium]MBI3717722.1 hypothetical protein [Sphingobacteriales bacterium]
MLPVYCISGLGADERVYSQLQLSGCDLHFIEYLILIYSLVSFVAFPGELCGYSSQSLKNKPQGAQRFYTRATKKKL